MPRPRANGLESYENIPLNHPQRRKIQNRNAQRTFRRKRAANNAQDRSVHQDGGRPEPDFTSASAHLTALSDIAMNTSSVATIAPSHIASAEPIPTQSLRLSTPQLDRFLESVHVGGSNPTPSGNSIASPSAVMNSDRQQSLDQFMEWQPQENRQQPSMDNKSAYDTSTHNSWTHSRNSATEEPFLTLVGEEVQQQRHRRQHSMLNSPCPSDEFARGASAIPPIISAAAEQQSHHRRPPGSLSAEPSRRPSVDNLMGSAGDNLSADSEMGRRQVTNSRYGKQQIHTVPEAQVQKSPPSLASNDVLQSTSPTRHSSGFSLDHVTTDFTSSGDRPPSGSLWRHLIHTCCEGGHLSLVQQLIEAGLDIDKRDSAGDTPLHIAAGAGHEHLVTYLVERGCNVNAANYAGWTAAHLASMNGHGRCLRVLVDADASPWAKIEVPD